jgi:YVTN family beta-propeller protein
MFQRKVWILAAAVTAAAALGATIRSGDPTAHVAMELPFTRENDVAMTSMMGAMNVRSSGDADADFVARMTAHHQGAIDMAKIQLRYGRNGQLTRIAQEIVVTQQQEIAAMRLALGQPRPPSGQIAGRGQAPGAASDPAVPVSHRDRVYAAEQFSNTVSVTDPADNTLVGTIRLGDPQPSNLSPLYRGQVLVHGMGFSPDHRTIAVVSIGTNSVSFIETATNAVKHVTYVGRAPHEAFFTPDGKEVWVSVRGEDYVAVLDGETYQEKTRIKVPNGPGMQIFSPDGQYGYVCSSFTPETDVISVSEHRIVGRVTQASPFCPNIAATPDGKQVWFTLKDIGKTMVFDARPPFTVLRTIETGPITNHVNFANNANGIFAYVSVGGLNEVQVFRTSDFAKVATIPVGKLPHGVWPSGDGSRIYVGIENGDGLTAINTLTNQVIATVPIGQAPQAISYVPNAVPEGDGRQGLQPLGVAGEVAHLFLVPVSGRKVAGGAMSAPTSVSLFEQGLTQVLQASVTGLQPKQPYVLALSNRANGGGVLEPLSAFTTNPAGSAIVNAVGPIRQIVRGADRIQRRYLVIVSGSPTRLGAPVQVQAP